VTTIKQLTGHLQAAGGDRAATPSASGRVALVAFPGLNPELYTQLGENGGYWKTSLGAKEHRLEAYATLVFRTVERSLKAILVAIAVNPRWRRDGVNVA
jgi:hypothetical protein